MGVNASPNKASEIQFLTHIPTAFITRYGYENYHYPNMPTPKEKPAKKPRVTRPEASEGTDGSARGRRLSSDPSCKAKCPPSKSGLLRLKL